MNDFSSSFLNYNELFNEFPISLVTTIIFLLIYPDYQILNTKQEIKNVNQNSKIFEHPIFSEALN